MTTYLSVFLACLVVGASQEYDNLCDRMITAASEASKAFNSGDRENADKKIEIVEAAFAQAAAIAPDEPQAYANMAQFCLNSNQLDRSLEYWGEVSTLSELLLEEI